MERLWFITNPASGTATDAKREAIHAACRERGIAVVETTHFPDDPLPDAGRLLSERVDTVALFAGDGTINAALFALRDWDGSFLILPGGTMNLLARRLHGDAEPADIVHAVHAGARQVALPMIEGGGRVAFVGVILGPAAHWFRAREAARRREPGRMMRAVRFAWRRTFGRGVRISGAPGLAKRYQAVFLTPGSDTLDVAAIDARDWGSIAELGWNWLSGGWVEARAVTERLATRVRIEGSRPVLALFDGEPEILPPETDFRLTRSRETFLATADRDAG